MSDGIRLSDCQFGDLRAFFYFAHFSFIYYIYIAHSINNEYTGIAQFLFKFVFTNVIIISSKGDTRKERIMKIYTANRDTGSFIEEAESVDMAKAMIRFYENEDKRNDVFEPNYYDVVNQNHESLL